MFRRLVAFRRSAVQPLRRNVGHGHHHSPSDHTSAAAREPYAVVHHHPYPDQAYPLGMEPGYKLEGWEFITYGTYFAALLCMWFSGGDDPDKNLRKWAHREALAREKVKENGGTIEFGKWYHSNASYEEEEIDTMPKIREKEE